MNREGARLALQRAEELKESGELPVAIAEPERAVTPELDLPSLCGPGAPCAPSVEYLKTLSDDGFDAVYRHRTAFSGPSRGPRRGKMLLRNPKGALT